MKMLDGHRNKTRNLFLIAGILTLILLCFIAYGEILGYYFTSMDAFPLLLIGKIDSLKDLLKVISSPLGGGFPFGTYYRPLIELSYGIDYLIWGKNPMGYHLTNILIHLANSILVLTTANIIFKDHKRCLLYAWASSVLFLLSPLNVVLVPAISNRQDMLTALLLNLTLLSFLKVIRTDRSGIRWYVLSYLFGFLAIFSKESAFVLPLLIWFLSFIFNERDNYRRRAIRALKHSLPFIGFALLNTIFHVYLIGYWGVRISYGIFQHFAAAARSFFTLMGPLELLHLDTTSEVAVFLIFSLIVFFLLLGIFFKFGLQDILGVLISKKWRIYIYLVLFIVTFMAMFTITGKAADTYHYHPNMALTILIVIALADTFERRLFSIFIKSLCVVLILYMVAYSPIFTNYGSWRNSSEITKKVIEETEAALNSDSEISCIYLINWPGFIGLESSPPGRRATILVDYSMNAWAKWSGLKSNMNVKFIPISYTIFPPGNLKASFLYTFSDERIDVDVTGCHISLPKFPFKGNIPFEFSIDNNKRKGEIVFIRNLKNNERLFLYDIKGIRMIDSNLKVSKNVKKAIKS